MKFRNILFIALVTMLSCEDEKTTYTDKQYERSLEEGVYSALQLSTDKAVYAPGETVRFTADKAIESNAGVWVRYRHLNTTLKEEPFSGISWNWTVPTTDFQGYMVDLYKKINGCDSILGSIAVDVSSVAHHYVRNGFLSEYGYKTPQQIDNVMKQLNRYHINYLQFQDWHYKHHYPLAGTPENPMETWTDICTRTNYKSTVDGYIASAHQYGMQAIFYNLAFGALDDAAADGVSEEWYLFKDINRTNKDKHALPKPPFKSDIFLVNPANTEWQAYIAERNDEVYKVFAFDGYQIDQLGGRGNLYDYNGNAVDLTKGYKPFIEAMKAKHPNKLLTMNAVSQYGQNGISQSPVEFLYTEVWDHSNTNGYNIFTNIIKENDVLSNGKETVLAAYLNYKVGKGNFNTPGIVMAMADAFAWGGSILQLGEHMLCNEYFPNHNMTMTEELKNYVIRYYDFLTAYENPLRDNGTWFDITVTGNNTPINFNAWPPIKNQVATFGKRIGNTEYIHFLSYSNATHLDWCDSCGNQGEPTQFSNLSVNIPVSATVKNVWFASPDTDGGVSHTLKFEQQGNTISLTLPSLKYWDMIAIEY